MDNQHKKITGYRDLSKEEIELMNKVKSHAEITKELLDTLSELRYDQHCALNNCTDETVSGLNQEQINESMRCIKVAKTELQTGQMWFVRAVALPNSF